MLLELGADLAEERSVPPGGDIPVLLLHHLLRGPHGLQVSGDGPLELRPGLVQRPQSSLGRRSVLRERERFCKNISHLEDCGFVCGGLGGSLNLLLLLESPEVILNEESCIELSNRHVIVN